MTTCGPVFPKLLRDIWESRPIIIGFVRVKDGAIVTHRDTFVLPPLSSFSIRRPFCAPALLLGGAFAGFTITFIDLLYPIEIFSTLGACAASILAGVQIAQLRLHSGDLRGTTLGHLVWGSHADLNKKRAELTAKITANKNIPHEVAQ